MRILYILTCLGVGGAQVQVLDIADRLVQRGHAVHLVSLANAPPGSRDMETNHPVDFLRMSKGPFSFVHAMSRVRMVVESFRPDVVHTHMFHANMFGRALRLVTTVPALVCTAHNTIEGGRHVDWAYRVSDGLADLTTNVSREATLRYFARKAAPGKKLVTVYNGIDTHRFCRDPQVRAEARQKLGVTDEFLWLAVGRLSEQKDYPNLIHAVAQLPAGKRRLFVAGAGDPAPLQQLARSLGLQDPIVYLGIRSDVPALMSAADGFVLSSAWEGFGMVVAEAMACECVPVATDCGGVREVVGAAGWTVPPRDPSALASTMQRVESLHAEERARIARDAREHVRRNFSLERIVSDWEDLYHGLRGPR